MYESYWGLRESPFRDRLDPQFFYPSATHDEALAWLHFLIEQRRRLGLLLGGPGSGKSLLLELLAAQLRRRGPTVARFNLLGLEADEMLHTLLGQLGHGSERKASPYELWRGVLDRLSELRYQRLSAAVIIDDADGATASALPHLTRLAKLEFAPESRLTLILAGDPDRLMRLGGDLMSLAELRIDLAPWTAAEIESYLQVSLSKAGCTEPVFDASAIALLAEFSQGMPRQIRQLADMALVAGAGQGLDSIDAEVIDSVYQELTAVAAPFITSQSNFL